MLKTRILLADDHPMLRKGIRELLEREQDFEIVAEAGDGDEAVRLVEELKPQVLVMDIGMPKLSGLEVTKRIKAKNLSTAVLILTIHDEDEYILGLLQAGVSGYLLKSVYGEELVNAIRSVRTGEFVLHPVVGQKLLKRIVSLQPKPIKLESITQLTNREIEVLKLAAMGKCNKDIAIELGIGVRTVKGHLFSIFFKMKVNSRTEAVLQALKRSWISLEEVA
jgi:two-component system, NarL family, response regulator LiaR